MYFKNSWKKKKGRRIAIKLIEVAEFMIQLQLIRMPEMKQLNKMCLFARSQTLPCNSKFPDPCTIIAMLQKCLTSNCSIIIYIPANTFTTIYCWISRQPLQHHHSFYWTLLSPSHFELYVLMAMSKLWLFF